MKARLFPALQARVRNIDKLMALSTCTVSWGGVVLKHFLSERTILGELHFPPLSRSCKNKKECPPQPYEVEALSWKGGRDELV